jgi:hypothetical protein
MPKVKDTFFTEKEDEKSVSKEYFIKSNDNLNDTSSEKEVEKKVVNKPKEKYTVLSISKGRIHMSYLVDGVKYGMSIPFEEKYKSLKAGDTITL